MNQLYRIMHMPIDRLIRKLTGHKEKYVVCIRELNDNNDILTQNSTLNFKILFNDDWCWYADPILQEYQGTIVLFMEQFDLKINRGAIACSIFKEGFFSNPVTIIKESFHMSFPFTFLWNEKMYMIPETSEDKSVCLYKAIKYPFEWQMVQKMKTKMHLVDSVVVNINKEKLTVLASEFDKKNGLKVRFIKYFIVHNNKGFSLEYDEKFNCRQKFGLTNRNAGKIVNKFGNLILPTQESTNVDYGFCLNFLTFKINHLNELIFGKNVKKIVPEDISVDGIGLKKMIGVHTYTKFGKYEIIDLRYLD